MLSAPTKPVHGKERELSALKNEKRGKRVSEVQECISGNAKAHSGSAKTHSGNAQTHFQKCKNASRKCKDALRKWQIGSELPPHTP